MSFSLQLHNHNNNGRSSLRHFCKEKKKKKIKPSLASSDGLHSSLITLSLSVLTVNF